MESKPENHTQLKKDVVLGERYLIQEVIGVGGMGAVYRARDLHFPNVERHLAIKEMINTAPDPEVRKIAIENFEREAHILATLAHPSIPKIFDFFSDEESEEAVLLRSGEPTEPGFRFPSSEGHAGISLLAVGEEKLNATEIGFATLSSLFAPY